MSLILEKHLLVLEYFPASLKIFIIFKIFHLRAIDYVEHSRINNVNEQNNVQVCSILNSCVVKSIAERLCRHNTFCLFFNFVHG